MCSRKCWIVSFFLLFFLHLPLTDVDKSEILHIWHVCDVENVAIYVKVIAIHAVLLLNLLFTLFCREFFATIYALFCGEKLSTKVHLWRKNDIYQVCPCSVNNVHNLQTATQFRADELSLSTALAVFITGTLLIIVTKQLLLL